MADLEAENDLENMSDVEGASDASNAPDDTSSEAKKRLELDVKIEQPSACQRHVTVTVSKEDIERYRKGAFDELRGKAAVPGFRPGRAPRKLVQSRFKKDVAKQIKSTILMDCLTQINEDYQLTAISEPSLDIEAVDLPDEGPMTFEFNLEVRPEFDLPEWKGLKLEKPVHVYTADEITKYTNKLLRRYGEQASVSGPVEPEDILVATIRVSHDEVPIAELQNQQLAVRPTLSFQDARISGFDTLVLGADIGDTRSCKTTISGDSFRLELQNKEVTVEFEISEILRVKIPRLDRNFLDKIGGFEDEEDLRSAVSDELARQLKYHQQQRVRQQITATLTATAKWELPPDMLRRQARREVDRAVLELQASGFGEDVIQTHANELRRNVMASTARALKEHFILERLAEEHQFDATPDDYENEIRLIAEQQDESPRRIRARLEKKGQMDSLRNQIIERKVIGLIEDAAVFTEVAFDPKSDNTTALDISLVGGVETEEIPVAKYSDGPAALPTPTEHH